MVLDVTVERVLADTAALHDCLVIRRRVFIEGQGIPEALELDGWDGMCTHFLARVAGHPAGTARLLTAEGVCKAERVAVLDEYRRCELGRALMAALEAVACSQGFSRIVLHAQEPVCPFYQRLGYRCVGDRFLEAGIPHREMVKDLP